MVIVIILSHFLYGGFIHLIVTKTFEAVTDYSNLYNWLNGGIVYSHDLDLALRNAIAWSAAALVYVLCYAALVYISINLLANS